VTLILQGTVICRSDRTALALVEDVFGPVSAPMYLLRFASQSTMEELLVTPGLSVFYPKVIPPLVAMRVFSFLCEVRTIWVLVLM
jgi:hypothetical protein